MGSIKNQTENRKGWSKTIKVVGVITVLALPLAQLSIIPHDYLPQNCVYQNPDNVYAGNNFLDCGQFEVPPFTDFLNVSGSQTFFDAQASGAIILRPGNNLSF